MKPSRSSFVIAHRGASAYAPENTQAAFLKAKVLGAQWIEFDVQRTADGQVVVFHDETLTRTTPGTGRVVDYPLAYLKSLDMGSWFHASFKKERILTLEEMMQLCLDLSLSANIEIKALPGEESLIAEAVVTCLASHPPFAAIPLVISSFNYVVLQVVKRLNPVFPLGYLMDDWSADWKVHCDELNCMTVNMNDIHVTPARVEEILQSHRAVWVYTVNDPQRAQTLFDWGVQAVFSDCPDKIMRL